MTGVMIGLDTNVLVRYLAQDDPIQSPRAGAIIESFTPERRGYISLTAMVELAWVLTSVYSTDKEGLLQTFELLLRSRTLAVEQADTVRRAVDLSRMAKADLEDCLIQCSCHTAGCSETITFDNAAAKTARMRLIR
jgi:predicted nucleic-acid-binding protein